MGPKAVEALLSVEKFSNTSYEPAYGGHISRVLQTHRYSVINFDIICHIENYKCIDFLHTNECNQDADIITNPPYKYTTEFCYRALEYVSDGHKVAMLLKLTFLETLKRRDLFAKYPFKHLYVFSSRIECAKNGNFTGGSAVAYGWFVWERGYSGDCIIKWI